MRTPAILLALLLGACTPGLDRRAYLNTLIGQTETEAVHQLGVPTRSFESGGHRFLAFLEEREDYLAGGPFFFGAGIYGPRYGYGAIFPTQVRDRSCETTLDVVSGRVVTWSLRGNACG